MKTYFTQLFVLLLGSLVVGFAQEMPARRPLTAADSIEATRLLPRGREAQVMFSPDGRRYVIFFEHGDLARNGTWVQLVAGKTDSLETARSEVAAELFTASKGRTDELVRQARWLSDNERVMFAWNNGGKGEIVTVNARTHEQKTVVQHPGAILDFAGSADGATVVYSARLEHDRTVSDRMRQDGFTVTDQPAYLLLLGDLDGWNPYLHTGLFASSPNELQSHRVAPQKERLRLLSASPDGRLAVVAGPAESFPPAWDRYTADWFKRFLASARRDPTGSEVIEQLYLVDLASGGIRRLWNAPASVYSKLVWSPDGRRLLVGPTFLPPEQAEGLALEGMASVDINVADGSFQVLPFPPDASSFTTGWREGYVPVRWQKDDSVEFVDTMLGVSAGVKFRFKKTGEQWERLLDASPLPATQAPVRIALRQTYNTPPVVVATEIVTSQERVVWESNPRLLEKFSLGRIEEIHWKSRAGEAMTGWLHYPVHFAPGKRFPLVLYFHAPIAGAPQTFSLDGGYTTMSAAQPLANQDIAVLQLRWSDHESNDIMSTTREAATIMTNAEDAIEYLSPLGWVDRTKIGVAGFSRTGWYVEYTLTHSTYPFAAAIAADNVDYNYVQYIMADGAPNFEVTNGGAPFGEGLKEWLRAAPAFNADKIHTPLRLELDSLPVTYAVVGFWEMFTQLRRHQRPVELYIVPDSEHGGHPLQNPQQRLASQGGAVDWFDFWLNGHERTEPVTIAGETKEQLADQYARWHKLRELHEADLKKMQEGEAAKPVTPPVSAGK